MKEIKFRAWDKIRQCWFSPDMVSILANGHIEKAFDEDNGEWLESPNNDIILMQYAGPHDKNGKEIYEGDKIKGKYIDDFFRPEEIWNGEIKYASYAFQVFWGRHSHLPIYKFYDIEVIGNIYEDSK